MSRPSKGIIRPDRRGRTLAAGALVGAASGLRSQTGVATVLLRADPTALPAFLRAPRTRRLLLLAAGGELVVDKLPWAPSRLEPPGLAARLILGGAAAGLLARTRHDRWVLAAATGAGCALIAAKVGHDLRARLDEKVPDLVVAPVEDAIATALAIAATRLAGA